MIVAILVASFLLMVPSFADAWGPLTHLYLGSELIEIAGSLIPAALYGLLKKYRKDFLYGNLSADIILGRRFQTVEKNSHNWDIAWDLIDSAETDRQRAFAYGYLMHLGADSVVHNIKPDGKPFSHSLLEVRSDCLIDGRYRRMLRGLDKYMQKRNDLLLEQRLDSLVFSFKTNKRIFRGFLFLSRLQNSRPVSNFLDNRLPYQVTMGDIYNFRQESLNCMIDLLCNGRESAILATDPMGRFQRKAS
jgi:hypothetical protein